MIYNSNGNNAPYQSGGNAKVQKELKALQEAINLVDANFNNYVDENDEDIVRIDNNIDAIELSVSDIGTRLSTAEGKITGYDTLVDTAKVQAQDADFHNVVAGKYVFQNGAAITGTNICKIADGSVVYATDGTNAILIDYTDKDAWVAKAKTELNQKFRIYSNGVLTFTQSGGWNVYVLGNDFSTDDFTVPEETPIEVVTGVTIGGTLYAALARDYSFDNITVTSATINSATVTLLTAPSATITDLTATNETVADLTVNNEGNINGLVNAKRNIQDEVNGKISVDSHPTNVQVYIGVHKFTGTYNLKLTHEVNGAVQTLFTATIIWNGKYPIVQYHEYADNEPVDYLYSMVLTDDALYFVTQGAGNLYYSYDAMGGALAPFTSEYPNIPYQPNDVIADYITAYHDRTVFFGNHEDETGIDILGEMKADIIQLPDDFSITNMYVDNDLVVGGSTTLTGDTTAGNITADKVESDELIGKSLQVKDDTDTYMAADENGVAVNVDTEINADLDVDGTVTVSEKETINELEPEASGYYVDHDYWTLSTDDVVTETGAIVQVTGTEKSRTQLDVPNFYDYVNGQNQYLLQYATNSTRNLVYCVGGTNYYSWTIGNNNRSTISGWPSTKTNIQYDESETSLVVVVTNTGETVLANNEIYVKKIISGNVYWTDHTATNIISDTAIINELNSRPTSSAEKRYYGPINWKQIKFTITGYTVVADVDVLLPMFANVDSTNANQTVFYTPYQEFVQGIDPNHQYTPADEVLTVKGSEKVTRDLKVQGFIYQDEYNRAVLPNINASTINSNGGVLIIGELD